MLKHVDNFQGFCQSGGRQLLFFKYPASKCVIRGKCCLSVDEGSKKIFIEHIRQKWFFAAVSKAPFVSVPKVRCNNSQQHLTLFEIDCWLFVQRLGDLESFSIQGRKDNVLRRLVLADAQFRNSRDAQRPIAECLERFARLHVSEKANDPVVGLDCLAVDFDQCLSVLAALDLVQAAACHPLDELEKSDRRPGDHCAGFEKEIKKLVGCNDSVGMPGDRIKHVRNSVHHRDIDGQQGFKAAVPSRLELQSSVRPRAIQGTIGGLDNLSKSQQRWGEILDVNLAVPEGLTLKNNSKR